MSQFDAVAPPGAPGGPSRWTSSAKSGVGTALTSASRIWFTISHGILNEIYYPRVDTACTRDFGLMVTGPDGYFSEEKRDASHDIMMVEDGVPSFRLVNHALDGRYRIKKSIVSDPRREALLQRIQFEPVVGTLADYRVFALLAPHLINAGSMNTAWVGDYKGVPMLFAMGRRGVSLALACSVPWRARSAGYVGVSDGWQQLAQQQELNQHYQYAADGNVALTGELDLQASSGCVELSLGFGYRPAEAGHCALSSLQDGFDVAERAYVTGWRSWQDQLLPLDQPGGAKTLNKYRVSTAVLASHQPASYPGAVIASLSIPWGFNKGDEDLGGYHLVWPRDLVETAGGFLAAGAVDKTKEILSYLQSIQEADGRWSQNVWLDGSPYWDGVQIDECAFPILLTDLLRRQGHFGPDELKRYNTMVARAAGYVVRNGPVTGQDRWEEDAGYSPFTLAVEIAGLLAAADILEIDGRVEDAVYLRDTADCWNDQIEYWTFATDTEFARQLAIEGYYVRIAPPDTADAASPLAGFVPVKNRPPGETDQPAALLISPDALALVRFGLRAADDPRMLATVKAIDSMLKVDLPQGPLWYRYNYDGYGEHDDGRAFDGTGIGRAWPLLTGERAHYELAAGRPAAAADLLATLEASSGPGGLLPEQSWDGPDIPERELFRGRPSGSAMPLVWAHAEHIKLLRSLRDGVVFDMPPQPVQRYQVEKKTSNIRRWCFNHKLRSLPKGKRLRIELLDEAIVCWSVDGWQTRYETGTSCNGFDLHVADLDVGRLDAGEQITFTFYWKVSGTWEDLDFSVDVE